MNNRIKLLTASTLAALMLGGCTTAPAPWANNPQQPKKNTPPGTSHQHGSVIHSHALPEQGINHAHQSGQAPGVMGSAVGSAPNNNTNNNNNGNNGNYTPPATYGYGYGNTNNSYGGSPYDGGNPYYNDVGGNNNSYYGGNNNYGNNTNNTNSSNYDNNPNYGSDYGANAYDTYGNDTSGSSSSDLEDVRDPNYRKGDTTYVVQKTNTVFAVMRITDVYWRDIVKWNNLEAPKYTIYPGQRLRLKP